MLACPRAQNRRRWEIRLDHATIEELLQRAVGLHQQGLLQQAAQLYARVIETEPSQSDALHLLGVVWTQSGDHERGAALMQMSLEVDPAQPAVWANLGNAQLAGRQFTDALASFDRSINLEPSYAAAHNGRGSALFGLQRGAESLQSFDRALGLAPTFAQALGNKGLCLLAQRSFAAAKDAFTAALALEPYNGAWLTKRGVASYALQRYEEALADCDRAAAANADVAELLAVQGNALLALGRPREVIAALAGPARDLATPQLCIVQGNALRQLGQFTQAARCYERALALQADDPAALLALGTLQDAERHHDQAAELLVRLREVAPHGDFHRGLCLHSQLRICDWRDYAREVPLIIAGIAHGERVDLPLCFLNVSDDAQLQQRCAEIYVSAFRQGYPPLHAKPAGIAARIRVVYLSSDFLEHPMAYLMTGVFESHDHSRFETVAVSLRSDPSSPAAQRLERAFDRFVDASAHSDEEVAQLIAGINADIVVDLMGYTSEERPGILLRRPAPVQISYLGMPATMGSSHIDYILADEFVIPPEAAACYSERVAYLPRCFQANDSRRALPSAPRTRAQLGLPEAGFVWACFSASVKINPQLFDVWMRLLHGTPGSVLWLLAASPAAAANLQREAGVRGVDSGRLVLAGRESYADHLARLRLADLCLDTWPFNGGATTSDALWSGVPVVTLAGRGFASRMSGSLLRAVGLPHLITGSLLDYERAALSLAADPQALASARLRLQEARGPGGPFDTGEVTRDIEAAYRIMHERACSGAAPAEFHVAGHAQSVGTRACA